MIRTRKFDAILSAHVVHGVRIKRHKRGTLGTYHGKVLVSGDKCITERNVLGRQVRYPTLLSLDRAFADVSKLEEG